MNTNNGTAGGGEILDYIGQSDNNSKFLYMDNSAITQFNLLPYIKIGVIILLIFVAILCILRLLKIKSPFKGRGIVNELEFMEDVRKRDASILRANNFIRNITTIVEHSPFAIDKQSTEYINYNLTRADIRIPGGHRVMKAEEYNALVRSAQVISSVLGLLIAILFNYMLGAFIIIASILIGNIVPMMIIRAIVQGKDEEIEANFSDFYLMIHYVLMSRSNTPLSGIMKSYDKTTNSEEMHKFVEVCVSCLDTYGEYEGPAKITERYKEIAVVGKLMRLIKQANEGADIVPELKSFRAELIDAKEFALQTRGDKQVAKAKASFNLLMPILIQAIISAMAIYFKDLSLVGSLM